MNSTAHHSGRRGHRLSGGGGFHLQVAALPWRKACGGVEVLLITSRDTGRWVLPKGWPDVGEALWDAAAREAFEEAGLSGKVSRREAGRFRYAKLLASRREVPCVVIVYPLEVEEESDEWKEKGQRRRTWVAPADAAGMVREPELSSLLAAFGGDAGRA